LPVYGESGVFGEMVWRDNCLQSQPTDPLFAYAALNYTSGTYSATTTLPFAVYSSFTACYENTNGMLWTSEYSYGPWRDWSTTSTYAPATGAFCRRGKSKRSLLRTQLISLMTNIYRAKSMRLGTVPEWRHLLECSLLLLLRLSSGLHRTTMRILFENT